MSRALLVLDTEFNRQQAIHWIKKAPNGSRVEFKRAQRSLDQNSKMWACLTDVATQLVWHGIKLTPDDWKLVFLDALKREKSHGVRIVPNLDSSGFVNLGTSSSDLSKDEMSELIELIHAFGAQHDVEFHEPQTRAA